VSSSGLTATEMAVALRRGQVTNEELVKARVRYRYETLASND